MLGLLVIANFVLTAFAIGLVQSRSPQHLHLLSLALVSLAVAYPAKTVLLVFDPVQSTTFSHSHDEFAYVLINVYYLANVTACIAAVLAFMRKDPRDWTKARSAGSATIVLAAISLLLILAYRDIYIDYYLDFSLVKNELRKRSLEAQVGAGWITVLMQAGLPFVYFSVRSKANVVAKILATALFISVLLVVGSRAYLLGTVLLIAVAAIGFSPMRTGIMLLGLAIAAAILGMISHSDQSSDLALSAVRRFMQTYDGMDIFAAYLDADRSLRWGTSILEDVFVTYIPRLLWEDKPFLFGSNEITASIFPELSDTRQLLATYPAGFLLEQYANFGLLGPAVSFLLFALLVKVSQWQDNQGKFVYLGLFAFAPTFFRSGASFLALLLLLVLLAYVISGIASILRATRNSLLVHTRRTSAHCHVPALAETKVGPTDPPFLVHDTAKP